MSHKSEKSKWLNNFDVLLIGATAILSGTISLLDFLGFLDGIPWLAHRIPTLTLLATGLIAGYLVLERRNQLEDMQADTDQRLEELSQLLSQSTVTIIDSLEGVELRKFETGNDMLSYVNKRLLQARQRIDDLSWSPALGLEHSLEATQEIEAQYAERIGRVSQRIPYREVFCFNRPGRVSKLEKRLEQDAPGYSCAYYEETEVPLLQFMIIDDEEVFILSDQLQSKLAIRHPYVVSMFSEYYEAIWNNATPIKVGTMIEKDVVERILGKEEEPR
jgi:hypothetical protein